MVTAFFAVMVVSGLAWIAYDRSQTQAAAEVGSVLAKKIGRLDRAGLTMEVLEPRRVVFCVDHRIYQGVPESVLKNLEAHWGAPVRVAALGQGRVSCEPTRAESVSYTHLTLPTNREE